MSRFDVKFLFVQGTPRPRLRGLYQLPDADPFIRMAAHPAVMERLEWMLSRAGVDIPRELIVEAVSRCRPCRLWAPPRTAPQTATRGPSRANQEVEGDYLFWEGEPLFSLLDRFQRFHRGRITVDRALPGTLEMLSQWLGWMGRIENLFVEKEGCMKSDEAALWLGPWPN